MKEIEGGSSPRTWGTLRHRPARAQRRRFIPTHVGNTSFYGDLTFASPVHPHARGEHPRISPAGWVSSGSSPRTWGTRPGAGGRRGRRRFIPTHVGNTAAVPSRVFRVAVHPHARGEHCPDLPDRDLCDGSSPRTWGTQRCCHAPRQCRRFIPTHVGNTSLACCSSALRSGSSPRTWGTHGPRRSPAPRGAVHPHARGEHARLTFESWHIYGSSPRTWGTHQS